MYLSYCLVGPLYSLTCIHGHNAFSLHKNIATVGHVILAHYERTMALLLPILVSSVTWS